MLSYFWGVWRQGGDLCSRLEEAERALALKQNLIDELKEKVEQQKGSLETVPVLTAQVRLSTEQRHHKLSDSN